MRNKKDIERVRITHNDSRNQGRIVVDVEPGPWDEGAKLDVSVAEAADLAERLLYAVRMSGYRMVAQRDRRPGR